MNKKTIVFLFVLIVLTTISFSCLNTNKTTSLLSFVSKSEENENADSTELETLNVSGFKSQYTFDPKVNSYNIEIFDNTYFLNIRAVPKSENANVEKCKCVKSGDEVTGLQKVGGGAIKSCILASPNETGNVDNWLKYGSSTANWRVVGLYVVPKEHSGSAP